MTESSGRFNPSEAKDKEQSDSMNTEHAKSWDHAKSTLLAKQEMTERKEAHTNTRDGKVEQKKPTGTLTISFSADKCVGISKEDDHQQVALKLGTDLINDATEDKTERAAASTWLKNNLGAVTKQIEKGAKKGGVTLKIPLGE